jgi:hypothetical protein
MWTKWDIDHRSERVQGVHLASGNDSNEQRWNEESDMQFGNEGGEGWFREMCRLL